MTEQTASGRIAQTYRKPRPGARRRRNSLYPKPNPIIAWIASKGTTKSILSMLLAGFAKIGFLHRLISEGLVNAVTSCAVARPLPFSMWGPTGGAHPHPTIINPQAGSIANYPSWPGLVDRTYSGRRLPIRDEKKSRPLPELDRLRDLFVRQQGEPEFCPRSSILLCFFAQWFTDSFLRTDPTDYRKNTSNHEIDLCQIYGLCESDTRILRAGERGLLRSEIRNGAEYPARLFEPGGMVVAAEFRGLSYIDSARNNYVNDVLKDFDKPERREQLHATGLERGNSTIVYSALNTVFLREHNRLAREIHEDNRNDPSFDDDRIFELARNTNIAMLLKVIIEDYINHLAPTPVPFLLDVGKAERQDWYRTNRISVEFDLLYRWHSLTPDTFRLNNDPLPHDRFRFSNAVLEQEGVGAILTAASSQSAGRIGLHNTPDFLVDADLAAMRKSRFWKMRGYNEYRCAFGMKPLKSITDLVGDDKAAGRMLAGLYGDDIDNIELLPGMLAETRGKTEVMGELMMRMVAVDAFSQALTNPLLSGNVYGEEAFSGLGLDWLDCTSKLAHIAMRNGLDDALVSFRKA